MSPRHPCPTVDFKYDANLWTVCDENGYKHHSFSYFNSIDDEAWYGAIRKSGKDDEPTLDKINQHLEHIQEQRIYPECPETVTHAPTIQENIFIKRPSFESLSTNTPNFIAESMLHEATIMERIVPHPNIITYHGCRVHHGRITGIVLEYIDKTLANTPIEILDIPTFLAELQSAVDHLHHLGLAHDDINPYNIMAKDGRPILIDFGGCASPGAHITSCGTPGWYEKQFWLSEVQHDIYAMKKLQEWLENGGSLEKPTEDSSSQ